MSRFDRYILSQLLTLFGFFALVLVAVYWVNRAVSLFDTLIASGQSVTVFLELSALSLPNVIRLMLPVAAFVATVYATNRLSSESELTIMQATGFSPWRLAKPVFVFGLCVAGMVSILTHFLVPLSLDELQKREKEVSANVTARLLTEGTFLHPTKGVTFYIREIAENGVLQDVYLDDRRIEGKTTTYTAAEGYLIDDNGVAKMLMVNGIAQRYDIETNKLSTTNFADFSQNISGLSEDTGPVLEDIKHLPTGTLLSDPHGIGRETGRRHGDVLYEAHSRFAQATICIVFAVIGFGMLMLGGYSRFGMWRQILIAFVILILLEGVKTTVVDPVRKDGDLWPLVYLPTLIGAMIAFGVLRAVAGPFRRKEVAA
ncbi:lipopolysaccharide export system permease protein [Shimia isoporae]|uniref:Lipopolysaccharide export system permease protein n=1 Tax=Shimia isoporae TaxID=647720 RepID=A0A4R1NWC0_9RHOB|nr:LPS export ABC transporter permease LptF [Shimia isoporae]TCL09588.1 lipopolysaccharide export system permease protein [Shimia isoporae]